MLLVTHRLLIDVWRDEAFVWIAKDVAVPEIIMDSNFSCAPDDERKWCEPISQRQLLVAGVLTSRLPVRSSTRPPVLVLTGGDVHENLLLFWPQEALEDPNWSHGPIVPPPGFEPGTHRP